MDLDYLRGRILSLQTAFPEPYWNHAMAVKVATTGLATTGPATTGLATTGMTTDLVNTDLSGLTLP